MRRRAAAAAAIVATVAAVVVPAVAADAQSRDGAVTVTLPAHIVLNGFAVPVQVSGGALHASDRVTVVFTGGAGAAAAVVRPNVTASIDTSSLTPSSDVALRVRSITTPCNLFDGDPCYLDSTGGYYEYVRGLTLHPSGDAVAKYAGRVSLQGSRSGRTVTWTATATQWDGTEWAAWPGAVVTVAGRGRLTDTGGHATWTIVTDAAQTATASAAESDTVWSATSAAASVAAAPPRPRAPSIARPTVGSGSTASTARATRGAIS